MCQHLGDEREDAPAHPRDDGAPASPHERTGAPLTSPGWQHCASAWAMGVETRKRIHVAIMCTSLTRVSVLGHT